MTSVRLQPAVVNALFPICGVAFYSTGLMVYRSSNYDYPRHLIRPKRGTIKTVSRRSLSRMVLTVGSSGLQFNSLLTLTYGQNYPINGKKAKADLNRFLMSLKRAFGVISYFWFLEFQKRGAPHFHLGLNLPAPDACQRELVAELWGKVAEPFNWPYTAISSPYTEKNARIGGNTQDAVIAQHRRSQTWQGVRSQDGAIRYCIKYATKLRQKIVPAEYRDVGRFWGASRDVKLPEAVYVSTSENELREVLLWLGRNVSGFEVLPKIIFHSGNLPEGLKAGTITE